MNRTPNYHLPTWAKADRIQMADFNDMTAKLDAALTAVAAAAAGKGNCRITSGTYTGNGNSGSGSPTRYSFPARPLVALVLDQKEGRFLILSYGAKQAYSHAMNGFPIQVSWSGNTVSFYADGSGGADAQMNEQNVTYRVYGFSMQS